MARGTLVGWLHQPGYEPFTWNIVEGCFPVSPGCKFCFAPNSVARQEHLPGRDGLTRKTQDGPREWTGKVALLEERLGWPAALRKPHMIFVTVLGDLFNAQVPEEFIARVWQVMADTPRHIYVILTKQPKRMRDIVNRMAARFGVLPHVWIGVSAEDQEQADVRLPFLMDTPAAIRVVSCEPLLGPIDLRRWLPYRARPGLDWVIVGGESARKDRARPMHPQWARQIRDQVTAAGVALFFKQWGSYGPAPWKVQVCDPKVGWTGTDEELAEAKKAAEKVGATHAYAAWAHLYHHKLYQPTHKPWSLERTFLDESEQAPMRFYPGKSAGNELDGRRWQQWPTTDGRIIEAEPELEAAR